MSETDSFIQEVTEEVRQDRMFALWKKWAPAIIGAIAVVVAGAAWWTWSEQRAQASAEAMGAAFLNADPAQVEAQQALIDATGGPARVLAELSMAAAEAEAGETARAASRFNEIAGRPDLAPAYAQFARLQALRLEGETDPAATITGLEPLIADGAPYRPLALELRAVLLLNTGDTAAAHDDLKLILANESGATEATRLRALLILTASGGKYEQDGG